MSKGWRTRSVIAAAGAALMMLAGCSAPATSDGATPVPTEGASAAASGADLTAEFVDPAGGQLGTVQITDVDGTLEMRVEVEGMPPGFHAFHVHGIGLCEPDSIDPEDPALTGDFLSAGGHVGADVADHGQHAGDLPSLFVDADGTGVLVMQTDAATLDELLDADGSAVMVHADLDNFANVPERYAPAGPDEQTLKTGDAGGRIACAVVEG